MSHQSQQVHGACAAARLGYQVAKNPVHVRDLHATMLKMFGFDAKRLSYHYQGLDQKLIGVKPAKVINDIIA